MADDEKTCPMCAERIKFAAKVCRFCGFKYGAAPMPPPLGARPAPPQSSSPFGGMQNIVFNQGENSFQSCVGCVGGVVVGVLAFVALMNWLS